MPVSVKEFVRVKDLTGQEYEGVGVANNIVAIATEDGTLVYGVVESLVKVRTTVVCDNADCINAEVNDRFQTIPRTIEFEDNGENAPDFIKKLSEIIIISDYKGEKKAYCSAECYSAMVRKQNRPKIIIPEGMGIVR